VDRNGSFAAWRFSRVHLTRSLKCACDLDAEVAQYRRAWLLRVVVEENVVAVGPKSRLATNEIPDFAHRRPPRRGDGTNRYLTSHSGQFAWLNNMYGYGDAHVYNTPY